MEYALINTVIGSIVTAFIFAMIARKIKLPAIFGYLVAGVVIGPHTPGFVADISLARQLAEIGIILLMFGVGLHFSLRDLIATRRIALPGALAQMLCATVIGACLAYMLGHPTLPSLIFGFSLSVASTIVLLRSLEQRNLLTSEGGRIAVSWLIVEDIAMVLALVMIPVISDINGGQQGASVYLVTSTAFSVLFKTAGFFVFMLVVGRRLLPRLLVSIAKMRSAELNTLGMLAIALGFASIAYAVFNASLALGAFLAGVMLSESEIGKKSAESTLPLRDVFSVLFFVSVGMLFDPATLLRHPVAVAMTCLIIVVAKGAVALLISRLFGLASNVGYAVAIGLSQIGEFSFILGGLALSTGLIQDSLYHLILAGAMISIVINPLLFRAYDMHFGSKR